MNVSESTIVLCPISSSFSSQAPSKEASSTKDPGKTKTDYIIHFNNDSYVMKSLALCQNQPAKVPTIQQSNSNLRPNKGKVKSDQQVKVIVHKT